MAYSKETLKKIHLLVKELGAVAAAQKLGLSVETVTRANRYFNEYDKKKPVKKANVLLLDIETAPSSAYVWNFFKTYINQEQVISDWFMLGWAVKWLFEPEVYSDILTPKEALAKDDKRITKNLWEYIEEADIIIAQNGLKFDLVKINTRFLVHGLKPPSPYQVIDTLLTLKKWFGFSNNKLNYVNSVLGLGQKEHTDFLLWVNCLNGDADALHRMESYNRNDVLILEELYVKIRPWIKSHPNMGLFLDSDTKGSVCPNCGCSEVELCGDYTTPMNSYVSFRCRDCGAIGRSRNSNVSLAKKNQLLRSIAR